MDGNIKKTMVVTGASMGVGEAVSKKFCGLGWRVFGIARSKEKLEKLSGETDGFSGHVADITDKAALKAVFKEIGGLADGRIDVLVNNAGTTSDILPPGDPRSGDIELLDPLIDINLMGPMYCTFLALPLMLPHKNGQIINVSSIAGLPGGPHPTWHQREVVCANPTYSVAKAGLDKFAQVMGLGLMENGIRMTTLNPGGIATPLWLEKNKYPGDTNLLMKPQELADLIEFLVSAPTGTLFKNMTFYPTCEWSY